MRAPLASALLGLTALLASGCAPAPLRLDHPLEEGCQVVVRDERPDAPDERAGVGRALLPLVPLVPWATVAERRFLERSFAPAVLDRLREANAFRVILGPGDPYAPRLEQPLELEVVLLSLVDRRVVSAWMLGPVGGILWAFGVPYEVDAAEASVRLVWRPRAREGRTARRGPFETSGAGLVRRVYTAYHDGARAARARAEEALGRAIDQALRAGARELGRE